jgi:hypothetical protein
VRRSDGGLTANLFSLVVSGGLAGLVVAALAFPAVAIVGLTARTGAQALEDLPTDLEVVPLPQMSEVVASPQTSEVKVGWVALPPVAGG